MLKQRQDMTEEEIEEADAKAESRQLRFKQQMLLGAGGAMIFGLAGAVSKILLDVIVTHGLALAPALGLAGIAVIGVGCLYMGCKYLTDLIMHDQNSEARKICQAQGKGKDKAIEIAAVAQVKEPNSFPIQAKTEMAELDKAETPSNIPSTMIDASTLQMDKAVTRAAGVANDNSWASRTTTSETGVDVAAGIA